MAARRDEKNTDPWASLCKRRLIAAILGAADLFPHPGEDEGERIHAARKALKEARALAKLMTGVIGAPAYEVVRELETARRRMGRARDLDVMPDALASLGGWVENQSIVALGQAIVSERERARAAHREIDVGAQATRLRALARGIEAWDLTGIDLSDIAEALRNAYRAARRRGRRALESGDAHELHELRAAIVDLGHYFEALEPAWPAHFSAYAEELHRMRELLGKHNDLTVLAEFALSRREVSAAQNAALSHAVERLQKRLAKRAERQFERLFAERPNALADRLTAYLDNPKKKKF